eukprot:1153855-Pelagomonas_calceolata.AAC.2
MGLLLLECHKNTHKFCSGNGISKPMAIGFDVQLQVLGGWTSVPSWCLMRGVGGYAVAWQDKDDPGVASDLLIPHDDECIG